jgi:hypothetical protein
MDINQTHLKGNNMRLKNNFLLGLIIFLSQVYLQAKETTENPLENQEANTTQQKLPNKFEFADRHFTALDYDRQIEEISNNGEYVAFLLKQIKGFAVEDFYPYIRTINNSLKKTTQMKSEALNLMLEELGQASRHFFLQKKAPSRINGELKEKIEEGILDQFIEEITMVNRMKKQGENISLPENSFAFASAPETLAQRLTGNITATLKLFEETSLGTLDTEEKEAQKMLSETILRLAELNLQKVSWDKSEHESIWQATIRTASNIYNLGSFGILGHMDQINDLYWSLIHRFILFLKTDGQALPAYFFEEIRANVESGEADFFLDINEPENFSVSKKQALMQVVIAGEAKAKGREKLGLV